MKNKNRLVIASVLSLGLVFSACGNDQAKEDKASEDTSQQVEESKDNSAENDDANKTDDESTKTDDNKAEEKEESEESDDDVSLSDWDGKWNSMYEYLEDDDIQPAYATLAEKDGVEESKAKDDYLEKRKTDFAGLVVDGDKITFLDNFPDKDRKTIGEGTYEFSKTENQMVGEHKITWNIFEATNDDAPYKYMILMAINPDEDLVHFHFRYGDDLDEILNKEGWFPTVVSPETTNEQLIEEITE